MTMALTLVARAVTAGSWLAVVGVPDLGIEAASELGVPPSRLVMVSSGRGPKEWAERVAAAADGFDILLTCPPAGAVRMERKLANRVKARGVVLVAVGRSTPGIATDIDFATSRVVWRGIGGGWGALTGRDVVVQVGGRRVPLPIEREMCLPGPSGAVALVGDPDVVALDRAG